MSDFWGKQYSQKFGDGHSMLKVSKTSGSDWSHIEDFHHGDISSGELTIKGREHLEQLHFAIGQLLNDRG